MAYPLRWRETFEAQQNPRLWQRHRGQIENADRKWLGKNCQEPVLDVGCGTGTVTEYFKDCVGLDITRGFLEAAHYYYRIENVVVADAQHLPFRDQAFKTAFAKDLLLHYPQDEGEPVIWEMLRVAETVYIAWGKGGQRWNWNLDYSPSNRPFESMMDGFYYNRYDLAKLEESFKMTKMSKDTTVTQIAV